MKKLKQKEWLTIPDAARYLSDIVQGQAITEADIIQYVLDNELTISIRMNFRISEFCCPFGMVETIAEASAHRDLVAELRDRGSDTHLYWYKGERYVTVYDDQTNMRPGTFDIASGGDSDEIVNALWISLVEGSTDCVFKSPPAIPKPEEETTCKHLTLIEPAGFISIRIPDYLIPPGSYFVVRKSEVDSLLESDGTEAATEKVELSTKEQNTLYRMVLGMAVEKYGYNPESARNKATGENAGSICADLEKAGWPVDADTIRKHLTAAFATIPPERI